MRATEGRWGRCPLRHKAEQTHITARSSRRAKGRGHRQRQVFGAVWPWRNSVTLNCAPVASSTCSNASKRRRRKPWRLPPVEMRPFQSDEPASRPASGGTYDVTGPQALSLEDIGRRLSGIVGRVFSCEDESIEAGREWRSRLAELAWRVEFSLGWHDAIAAGELERTSDTALLSTGNNPLDIDDYFSAFPGLLLPLQRRAAHRYRGDRMYDEATVRRWRRRHGWVTLRKSPAAKLGCCLMGPATNRTCFEYPCRIPGAVKRSETRTFRLFPPDAF